MEKGAPRSAAGPRLDPSDYIEVPVLDSPGTLALARSLIELAGRPWERTSRPAPLSSHEIQLALRRLVNAENELALATRRRELATRPELRQPVDLAVDNAWTAMYERLRAYAMLPIEQTQEARHAQNLLRTLFPDGLGFLRLPYEKQWEEGENRLRTIEQLRLAADLHRLAGAEFLAEVRRTHELYGKVLGLSRGADGPQASQADDAPLDSATLRELRFAVSRAISQYALKIVALADEDDQLVRRVLAPIEDLRRRGR